MTLEFTEQDLAKLNDLIQNMPFKHAQPLFVFFQGKITEVNQSKVEEVPQVKKLKKQNNGN